MTDENNKPKNHKRRKIAIALVIFAAIVAIAAMNKEISKDTPVSTPKPSVSTMNLLTSDEYKDKALKIDYEDLCRNPDAYKGIVIEVTLTIAQILGNDSSYRGKAGDDEWFVTYRLQSGNIRILEKDTVTFWGEYKGLIGITRALTNTKVYIPHIYAKYHDIAK